MQLADDRNLQGGKQACETDLLPRLHQLRGRMPDDFHFNRLEANVDLPNGVLDDVKSESPNFEKL
jgi:hypothetical protein